MFDLPLFTGDMSSLIALIKKKVKEPFSILVTLNPEILVYSKTHDWYKRYLSRAGIVVADGVGITLAYKFLFRRSIPRITGIELSRHLFESDAFSFYFVGSTETIMSQTIETLKQNYPNLRMCGFSDGYFNEQEEETLLSDIRSTKPDIVLVGMGMPLQESFLMKVSEVLDSGVGIGVGGSFDVISGTIPRAPRFLQTIGLEWLYRAFIEPQRMKRWTFIPKFLGLCFKERL